MKTLRLTLTSLAFGLLILTAACHRSENGPPADQAVSALPEEKTLTLQNSGTQPQVSRDETLLRADQTELSLATPSSSASPPAQTKRNAQDEVDALFANPTVLRIDLEISRAGMNALNRTRWGNGQDRPTAKATVRENGVIYRDVSVHLKGAAGSFRPLNDKPAMTLKFDAEIPGQRFHGLNKISLNNSVQDPSFLNEKIGRELFLAAGVPVPRAAHALVTLNGRDLGFYVLLEGANKQFLKRHFKNAKGNLYDGGFCQEIDSSLAVNCGDNQRDHTGLTALRNVFREPRLTYTRLSQVLDTDRFLSMLAIEVMLSHWDGYTMNKNNWRVFHDLEANRMVFIPHGMDQLFGSGRPFEPGNPFIPQHLSGDVSRVILASAEGRRRYRERFGYLYTNVFNAEQMGDRVDELASGLRQALAESHPAVASSLQSHAKRLKQRISRRGHDLRRQLGAPAPNPVPFDQSGSLQLTDWKPDTLSGNPKLHLAKDTAGRNYMIIAAGDDGVITSASWRTRALLAPGRYQFEGRVRASGVTTTEGDTRGGAGLRISKGTMPKKLTGNSPWTPFQYEFSVEDEVTDVELICELRAAEGQAAFDSSSLRLVRLP